MGKRQPMTETEVKKVLGIDSFRNLSKEKITQFVSMIPNMDKEVAMSIINQFPAYTAMAKEMVSVMKEACYTALDHNDISQQQVVNMYQQVLNSLEGLLKKNDLSTEERQEITAYMVEIANKMAEKDTENKNFILEVLRWLGRIALGLSTLGLIAFCGINLKSDHFT